MANGNVDPHFARPNLTDPRAGVPGGVQQEIAKLVRMLLAEDSSGRLRNGLDRFREGRVRANPLAPVQSAPFGPGLMFGGGSPFPVQTEVQTAEAIGDLLTNLGATDAIPKGAGALKGILGRILGAGR